VVYPATPGHIPSAATALLSRLGGTSARAALAGLTVADLMVRTPVTRPASVSVQGVMDQVFLATRHTTYPVLEAGEVAGLVSFRQLVGRLSETDVMRVLEVRTRVASAATERRRPQPTARPLSSSRWAR
jgi:CBS domain-containing protein